MFYQIKENKIIILDKSQFNQEHILECGQIFCYQKTENGYMVLSGNKMALVKEENNQIVIETPHTAYFEHFFDLKTDYNGIKQSLLATHPAMAPMIAFGSGIRILNQDINETVIGFIISANNNIKRIQKSMNFLREHLGENMGEYYAFPSLEKLQSVDETFFVNAGLGYRAKQMVKAVEQLSAVNWQELCLLPTAKLREELLKIQGIGGKVADCILLFAFHRPDVFPVDTWVQKIYADYFFDGEKRAEKMRENLKAKFGELSGFAQQYLFYYKRSEKGKKAL